MVAEVLAPVEPHVPVALRGFRDGDEVEPALSVPRASRGGFSWDVRHSPPGQREVEGRRSLGLCV
eukprot:1686680-Lingulodinium_polyedra.AAC.1